MKKSNKVLLFSISGLFLVMLIVLLMGNINVTKNSDGFRFKFIIGNEPGITGSGKIITQHYSVAKFNAINLKFPSDMKVKVIDEPKQQGMQITGDDNLFPYINVYVQDGTLNIASKSHYSLKSTGTLKIKVNAINLQSIALYGNADIDVKEIKGDSFILAVYGLGDSVLQGSVKNLFISVEGSGDVNAKNLKANHVKVEIKGSGDVTTYAARSINVVIKGSGDVRFYGNPKQVSQSIFGSGDIEDMSVVTNSVIKGDSIVDSVKVNVRGSGDVVTRAGKSTNVEIHGSGKTKYYGNPKRITQSIHGSGEIETVSSR